MTIAYTIATSGMAAGVPKVVLCLFEDDVTDKHVKSEMQRSGVMQQHRLCVVYKSDDTASARQVSFACPYYTPLQQAVRQQACERLCCVSSKMTLQMSFLSKIQRSEVMQ